ncbi:MAG: family 43 glycosylhydrolase, partial [Saprospiraceae bacterium]
MKKQLYFFILIWIHFQVSSAQSVYTNPILSGFYPDPSICRVGEDYYMVTSSFAYFPGLPVMHSKDLLSWHQLGYAMDRKEQLQLDGAGVSRGLFAASIRYHDSLGKGGLFYITCTLVEKGGNFVITASDPKGPWSDPVYLPDIHGIDPSLFFDDDRAYLVYNSIPPGDKSLYDGHRTIRMYELDIHTLKIKGDEKLLINGGTDLSKKPIWIEAPHILKKDDWYYLYCAEGGTEFNHSEVVFKSRSVTGPYVSYDKNPILTQRDLDPLRRDPITSTGHADFVNTEKGDWYAVFLGCRPYTGGHYNTGRETFMAPVKWIDGWPVINPDFKEIQYSYPAPVIAGPVFTSKVNEFSTNQLYHDHFDGKELNNRYTFLRTPEKKFHEVRKGKLWIDLLPTSCAESKSISMVADRQNHLEGYVTCRMEFQTQAENEKAGLIVFQNEHHYYYMCKSADRTQPVVQLFKGPGNPTSPERALDAAQLL